MSVAGVHLTDIPRLVYAEHLFQERDLRGTTANTRADGEEFLAVAAEHRLSVTVTGYPLDAAEQAGGGLVASACGEDVVEEPMIHGEDLRRRAVSGVDGEPS